MTPLQHLCQLKQNHQKRRYPNVPDHARPKPKYSDKTANSLTVCVVDWLQLNGHFASRLSSTGTYRNDLQKFVASQQRSGLPDVLAVVAGAAVFVEIKAGKDRLSSVQKEVIDELKQAGARVYVASSFDAFYAWYQHEFTPTSTNPAYVSRA
ncbi:hypothetical protein GCM10023187_48490 [Nibrella viscosa]|uniref:VRR-NUC domain-containing protein n=1 Tax=Nibrella viscosa TaxID=1084524 RepID=A0ABP8KV45_9BACT